MSNHFQSDVRRALRVAFIVACLLMAATRLFGNPVPMPPAFPRPDGDAGPTKVSVGMWASDIVRIDSVEQSFEVGLFVVLRWHDPGLAHSGQGIKTYALDDVWHPKWIAVNGNGSLRQILPEKVEAMPDGTVIYRQQVVGSFIQKLDLREFPFDRQRFCARFAVMGYRPEEIQFVPDESMVAAGCPQGVGIAKTLTLADWKVDAPLAYSEAYHAVPGIQLPGYVFEFPAARLSKYYLLKVLCPLLLIVLMSWTVFWIDPGNGGSQIGVATTSMLTLIAYRFAVGADVPKLPYLTRFDAFTLASTLLVFFALVEVMVTTNLASGGNLQLSRLIDRRCRFIFPILFVISSTIIFFR